MNLFGITFYRMTGKQIAENYKNNHCKIESGYFCRHHISLPSYVINEEETNILETEYYFQFFNNPDDLVEDEKEYILMELGSCDSIISEEIGNIGFEDFMETIGFLNVYGEIKDKILIHDYDNLHSCCVEQFFILKINSYEDRWSGEYDYDMDLIGYFDKEFNLIKI
jgi:hypothetical protein